MELRKGALESMVKDVNFWKNKRVLVTGNTGFKGSWLSIWLSQLGANLRGYSLPPPTNPSLFVLSGIGEHVETTLSDIRDSDSLKKCVQKFDPEIIFHLAAQPLVRASYQDPVETFETNLMGTVNLFEAARKAKNLKVLINVTSDKCYQNNETNLPFEESDPMGGHDPYSASKGCSELITNAYRSSFFAGKSQDLAVSSVRAGNVIGGGDWSVDRIVPDFFRALETKKPLLIRSPESIRPWQHVLEPLSGYLLLAEKMFVNSNKFSQAWNFGPNETDAQTVKWLIDELAKKWNGININFSGKETEKLHEAKFLRFSISKSCSELAWTPKWSAVDAINMINEFYSGYFEKQNILDLVVKQINMYTSH